MDEQCPTCGYCCLGKGGFGCIDKTTMPPATGLVKRFRSCADGPGPEGEPYFIAADVEAWLETHLYPRQYNHTVHNGVIDDLLEELRGGGA